MSETKKVVKVDTAPTGHWVGDGFPVRSLIRPEDPRAISPFLLLDYGGPAEFDPAERRRGVGPHPHKGFETVTIVFDGEIEHRDSKGGSGKIGPGDVQWMTAASGLIHEEMHSGDYTRSGGPFEMVQLWVNLPARDKSNPPRYQTILSSEIPAAEAEGVSARIIAGERDGKRGPAETHTPMNVWDIRLDPRASFEAPLPAGHNAAIVLLQGRIHVGDREVGEASVVWLTEAGEKIAVENGDDPTHLLVLSGEPIDEPVVAYGPFVMNTRAEIAEAIDLFNSGQLGRL